MQNTLSYAVTTNTQAQAQAIAAALRTQFSSKFNIAVTLQQNSLHSVTVTRVYKCYNKAVAQFNKSVNAFCSTAAQHICTEEHVVSCYVLDEEGFAVY